MTKYCAQSGGLVRVPEKDRKYFSDIFSNFEKSEVRMLWCFFASDGYETADNFSKWSGLLGKFFPDNLRIEHNVALQQCKNLKIKS